MAAEIAALIDRVWPNGCCNPDPVLLLLEQARAAAMTDDDARKTNQTNTTMNKHTFNPDTKGVIHNPETDPAPGRYTFSFYSESMAYARRARRIGLSASVRHHLGVSYPFRSVIITRRNA